MPQRSACIIHKYAPVAHVPELWYAMQLSHELQSEHAFLLHLGLLYLGREVRDRRTQEGDGNEP